MPEIPVAVGDHTRFTKTVGESDMGGARFRVRMPAGRAARRPAKASAVAPGRS